MFRFQEIYIKDTSIANPSNSAGVFSIQNVFTKDRPLYYWEISSTTGQWSDPKTWGRILAALTFLTRAFEANQ
jgi:hypothetical protein